MDMHLHRYGRTLVVFSPPVDIQLWPKILSYLRMLLMEYWWLSRNSCVAMLAGELRQVPTIVDRV